MATILQRTDDLYFCYTFGFEFLILIFMLQYFNEIISIQMNLWD